MTDKLEVRKKWKRKRDSNGDLKRKKKGKDILKNIEWYQKKWKGSKKEKNERDEEERNIKIKNERENGWRETEREIKK